MKHCTVRHARKLVQGSGTQALSQSDSHFKSFLCILQLLKQTQHSFDNTSIKIIVVNSDFHWRSKIFIANVPRNI